VVVADRYWFTEPATTDLDRDSTFGEEETLVDRARRDPAAFAPLYSRYVGPIYRYCAQALGSREAAEDATSLTFTKALAALPRYRSVSFRGWLFTIARHAITDVRRRQPTSTIDAAFEIADESQSPEDRAVAAEARRSLKELLKHLTADQRDVVVLRLAGLTGPEIAEVLGRNASAIKSTQFRAYARLRALIGDENNGEMA
jgi:RNA polymerase sigma factor (sigma-70 family)